MSRPEDELDDYLKGRHPLSEDYANAPEQQPPAALDSEILARAKSAVADKPAAAPRRPGSASWMPSLAAAAMLVLCVGLVLELQQQPQSNLSHSDVVEAKMGHDNALLEQRAADVAARADQSPSDMSSGSLSDAGHYAASQPAREHQPMPAAVMKKRQSEKTEQRLKPLASSKTEVSSADDPRQRASEPVAVAPPVPESLQSGVLHRENRPAAKSIQRDEPVPESEEDSDAETHDRRMAQAEVVVQSPDADTQYSLQTLLDHARLARDSNQADIAREWLNRMQKDYPDEDVPEDLTQLLKPSS